MFVDVFYVVKMNFNEKNKELVISRFFYSWKLNAESQSSFFYEEQKISWKQAHSYVLYCMENDRIIVAQCEKTINSLACHAYFFHQINLWQSSLVKRLCKNRGYGNSVISTLLCVVAWNIFREINFWYDSLVKKLFSRNFCENLG